MKAVLTDLTLWLFFAVAGFCAGVVAAPRSEQPPCEVKYFVGTPHLLVHGADVVATDSTKELLAIEERYGCIEAMRVSRADGGR